MKSDQWIQLLHQCIQDIFLSAGSSDVFFITALMSSYDAYNRKEMKEGMNAKENGM